MFLWGKFLNKAKARTGGRKLLSELLFLAVIVGDDGIDGLLDPDLSHINVKIIESRIAPDLACIALIVFFSLFIHFGYKLSGLIGGKLLQFGLSFHPLLKGSRDKDSQKGCRLVPQHIVRAASHEDTAFLGGNAPDLMALQFKKHL